MQLKHTAGRTHAAFDDPNLVSCAGLVPVMRLAGRAGLDRLVAEHVHPVNPVGVNAAVKVGCLVGGMTAGADSINDLDLLRHGAMPGLFAGVRAPSTLGSFLRALDWGNVRQLGAVHHHFLAGLAGLAGQAPLLAGGDVLAFVDIDACQRRVFGPAKQGAAFGHTKIAGKSLLVRGLNALVGIVSTPTAPPLVAGVRLRGGNAASARGAASFIAETVGTARAAGATGTVVVRADSGYYARAVTSACRRAGAHFSVTVRMDPKIRRTIGGIDETAWTSIRYPRAVFDQTTGRWISDAQITEVPYTAFASSKAHRVTGRLIVRRVKDLNPKTSPDQGELFPVWRHHAVFTDSPFILAQAEDAHRDHAIIEQTLADMIAGPLAHLPSGSFPANAAWLTLTAIAQNLTRAAGTLASAFHAKARAATIRRDLITIPGRTARHGRGYLTLHLPLGWPTEHAWNGLFHATHQPATARAG